MSDKSGIEWTDATWNPVTGCTKVSAGCANCYAETFSERWRGTEGHHFENGFDLTLRPERLEIPIKWKKPRRIFVNSMSDLFHKDIPLRFIEKIFDTMRKSSWHTFQVLTKRSDTMQFFSTRYGWPDNVMAGVSIENRDVKTNRLRDLHLTRARFKFLSLEPLLQDLGELSLDEISWVIVGGESGAKSRPIEIEWVRSIRNQCLDAAVPFFFKQWGGINKKRNGRMLDGRTWDEFPVMDKVIDRMEVKSE